jgi:2-oxoisovalerate dehydrogenase E1 component
MDGATVDGTDPLAVYDAVFGATERARAGDGPTFVEAVAHRLGGHFFGDGAATVDQERLRAAREAAPLITFRARLLDSGLFTEDDVTGIETDERRTIDEAFEMLRGMKSPVDGLFDHVYAGRTSDGSFAQKGPPALETVEGPIEELGLVGAVNLALTRAMARDESVIVLGEDVAAPGGITGCTKGLLDRFDPDRVRDTPIAESSIIGAALGTALGGLRPVPEIMFPDFLAVCLDQIANHAAKTRYLSRGRRCAPMTIRTMVGNSAGPQHSQALELWVIHVPMSAWSV